MSIPPSPTLNTSQCGIIFVNNFVVCSSNAMRYLCHYTNHLLAAAAADDELVVVVVDAVADDDDNDDVDDNDCGPGQNIQNREWLPTHGQQYSNTNINFIHPLRRIQYNKNNKFQQNSSEKNHSRRNA